MTPEQQRIAILKEMGWTETEPWLDGRRCFIRADSNSGWNFDDLPDYLNDLNAMHEAEQMLWRMDWRLRDDFVDHLARIINSIHGYRMQDGIDLLDATAAQRAEAFLKTIDKWTTN